MIGLDLLVLAFRGIGARLSRFFAPTGRGCKIGREWEERLTLAFCAKGGIEIIRGMKGAVEWFLRVPWIGAWKEVSGIPAGRRRASLGSFSLAEGL